MVPETQPLLLDYIKDVFIGELLPNITRYMIFAEKQEHSRHAIHKAGEVITQLKQLSAEAKEHLKIHGTILEAPDSIFHPSNALDKYKTYGFAEKILCLIVDEELAAIEKSYAEMQSDSEFVNIESADK